MRDRRRSTFFLCRSVSLWIWKSGRYRMSPRRAKVLRSRVEWSLAAFCSSSFHRRNGVISRGSDGLSLSLFWGANEQKAPLIYPHPRIRIRILSFSRGHFHPDPDARSTPATFSAKVERTEAVTVLFQRTCIESSVDLLEKSSLSLFCFKIRNSKRGAIDLCFR